MRKLTLLAVLVASIYCSVNPAKPVMANGWEHGAIPFEDLLRALSFDDDTTRARAAQSLGLRGQPEAVAPLIAMLGSESVLAVRIEIFTALGKLGSPAALLTLLNCIDRQEQETVRSACTTALADIGGERAMSRLIQALDDESFLVRSMAVEGLSRFPSVLAVKSLEMVYRSDNRSLKRRALHALGMTGMVQSAPVLLEALEQAAGVKLDKDNAKAWYRLGLAYDNQKQYDKAVKSFSQAVLVDPRFVKAYQSLGFTYESLGERESLR